MDHSHYKFHDIKLEKANAISRYRRIQRITTLFRFVELFVFLIILSKVSTQFSFPFNVSSEFLDRISATLFCPRFVFVVGNTIVVVLLLISGGLKSGDNKGTTDFYDEYVEQCGRFEQTRSKVEKTTSHSYIHASGENNGAVFCKEQVHRKEVKRALHGFKNNTACSDEKNKMHRSRSENFTHHVKERHRELRRSMTEKCRKSVDRRKQVEMEVKVAVGGNNGGSSHMEDEMSSEEFRRTVEAFIARQQRVLREEEEESSSVL